MHPGRLVQRYAALACALAAGALTATGCGTAGEEASGGPPAVATAVSELQRALQSSQGNVPSDASEWRTYRAHYGLAFDRVDHELSSITVGTERIAVQTFKPSQPRGTILISHGYLDHTGLWSHAIAHFLDKSYAVVAFDYPGHGLSTGQPADIDDFTTYRDVLDTVATRTRNRMASPVHLVGHSMGAGLIAEHILRSGLAPPRRAVLIAPNIRSNHWLLSRAGHTLASPFMNHVPRLNKAVSSNQAFLEFRANQDPLQAGRTPLRWFRELVEWQREMQTLPPHSADVRIIQGTADGVTDWTYNLPFLQKKLPGAHSVRLPGARHHLINETPPLRQRTLRLTTDYLRP